MYDHEAARKFCEELGLDLNSSIEEEARKMIDEEADVLIDYRKRDCQRITQSVRDQCMESALSIILDWVRKWDQDWIASRRASAAGARSFVATHRRPKIWAHFLGKELWERKGEKCS